MLQFLGPNHHLDLTWFPFRCLLAKSPKDGAWLSKGGDIIGERLRAVPALQI
jgi:hypothetical protein